MFTTKFCVTALLENRPDLLSRTVALLHRRSFELDGFTLGHTDRDEVARLTLVIAGSQGEAERLARELKRLVHVIRVDVARRPGVVRQMALVKVSTRPETRPEVLQLCEAFRARLVDVAREMVIVELTGEEAKIDNFIEVLRPFGIVEMVRSGPVALGRSDDVLDTPAADPASLSSWTEHRSRIESTQWN